MDLLPRTTARLTLRQFTRRDLPLFVAYRNHPEVARSLLESEWPAAAS